MQQPQYIIIDQKSYYVTLQKGQIVTVVYYGTYEQDYIQLTGPVTKIDAYWHSLQVGNTTIDFLEIDKLLTASNHA